MKACLQRKLRKTAFTENYSRKSHAKFQVEVRETQSALDGFRKQIFDKNSERHELRGLFDAYMLGHCLCFRKV